MKRLSVIVLFVSVCISLNGQKGYQCRWRDNPSGDYQVPEAYYSPAKKGAVNYCFTNDDSNVYLDMKITESSEQVRILKTGLTLWIDTEGKARKKLGIRFPIGSDYMGRGRRPDDFQQQTPLSMANTIQMVGFSKEGPSHIPAGRNEGIRGSVHYDNDGNLIYRLVIPWADIESFRKDPGKPLTFCIEYGAPPPDIQRPSTGMPSGGMSGGTGRPSGGSRGSGGTRSGGGGMPSGGGFTGGPAAQPAQPPVVIWVKNVSLTNNK